jgi:hypothetical protein
MKLIGWDELRRMPAGTIIQRAHRGRNLDPPMVFGGDCSIDSGRGDYLSAALLPEDNYGGVLGPTRPEGVEENNRIVFMPSGFGRYGLYDLETSNAVWLVWEQADRERLARWLLDSNLCAEEQNSDDYSYVKVPD